MKLQVAMGDQFGAVLVSGERRTPPDHCFDRANARQRQLIEDKEGLKCLSCVSGDAREIEILNVRESTKTLMYKMLRVVGASGLEPLTSCV